MQFNKGSGLMDYETLDDLLNSDIEFVSEYDGFYYFKMKPRCRYDNSIWKVNKKTEEVSYMMFTLYLCDGMLDKATPVDIEKIKRERKKSS